MCFKDKHAMFSCTKFWNFYEFVYNFRTNKSVIMSSMSASDIGKAV